MEILHEWLMIRPVPENAVEVYVRTMVLAEGQEPFALLTGADFTTDGPHWADTLFYLGAVAATALWQLSAAADSFEPEGRLAETNSR
jgi:hypothetical protein